MAKIEWVFQNEVGTNLNRYRATNVNTNEVITFDLLRNASISVVGTPLNAENMNSLITSINALYDNLSTLSTQTTNSLSLKEDKSNLKALAYKNGLTKEEVGLGNADNTSDLNKPISTATQNALDLKADKSELFSKNYNDLTNKPTIPTKTSQLTNDSGYLTKVSKSDVGLGNVDNTADANKSVKYATSSGSATNDSSGNNISTTYQNKKWTRIYNRYFTSSDYVNVNLGLSSYNEILFCCDNLNDINTYHLPVDFISSQTLNMYSNPSNSRNNAIAYFSGKTLLDLEVSGSLTFSVWAR